MSAIGAGEAAQTEASVKEINLSDIKNTFIKHGPICNSEGFYQHYGECWSDAFQMLMLYQDGIKEFTQPKLALEDINEKQIKVKFEELVTQTGYELKGPLDDRSYAQNLRAIYLYFKAIQERFQRHYSSELTKYYAIGFCGEYDKLGKDALTTLKNFSKHFRSKGKDITKTGVQAAIMSKKNINFFSKNREKITVANYAPAGKTTGGSIEAENLYLISLYNTFFNLNLATINYSIQNFTSEVIEKNGYPLCFYTNVKVVNLEKQLLSRHATSFYTCGKKEYYFDNEFGLILFPWHMFFDEYLSLSESNQCDLVFTGTFEIEKADTFINLISFKKYPYIRYEKDGIKKYITYIEGINERIELELSLDKQTNKYTVRKGNLKYILEIKLIETYYQLEKLLAISNTMDIPELNTKMNLETGLYQSSRLRKNEKEKTLLAAAIINQDKDKILYAIDVEKEDINTTDSHKNTALHAAIFLQDFNFVKDLVGKNGINLNSINNNGKTPLLLAIMMKEIDIAEYLLDKGADQYIADSKSSSGYLFPIEYAISISNELYKKDTQKFQKSLILIKKLLEQSKQKNLNYKAHLYKSLNNIIRNNNLELLELLVSYGLDVNKLVGFDYPILTVIREKNLEMFKFIMENGADYKIAEQGKRDLDILLHLFQYWETPDISEVIDLLIQKGFNPNRLLSEGKTYLWPAIYTPNAFDVLLNKYQINPNIKKTNGENILMYIVKTNSVDQNGQELFPVKDYIENLLYLGVNIDEQDSMGNTALMYTLDTKDTIKKIKILCSLGANKDIQNNKGNSFYTTILNLEKKMSEYKGKQVKDILEALETCPGKKNTNNIRNMNKKNTNKKNTNKKNTNKNSAKGAGEKNEYHNLSNKRPRKTRRHK